jgi:hypothetical protein
MPEETKTLFITKYTSVGVERFYAFILEYAQNRIISDGGKKNTSPEIELMQYYEKFLSLYRHDNKEVYLDIAKLFRKAAHCVYREMLAKNMIKKNSKFLAAV